MPSLPSSAVPVWPDAVRKYVEYEQEKAYRHLGDISGKSGDPKAIRDALVGESLPKAEETPEAVATKLGLTGKFTPEQWEKVRQQIAQVKAAPKNIPAPTRYEDLRNYLLMNEFRLIIMERAAKAGRPVIFPPFLATLPSGDVNANIGFPPGARDPVLFFEQGLVRFLFDFAGIVSWVVPALPPENLSDETFAAIRPRHTMPFEASALFASSLRSYVVNGNPLLGSVLVPRREENAFLADVLFMRMMMFVFMHEYSHLRLGHLTRTDTRKEAQWQCEYEADIAAATFLTGVFGGWALSVWACDLALIAFNFLDRALGVFEFGAKKTWWISKTHPSALSRRDALFKKLGAGIPEGARAAGGNLFAMNQALFQRLWEIAVPQFVEEHNGGAQPSPLWAEKMEKSMALAN